MKHWKESMVFGAFYYVFIYLMGAFLSQIDYFSIFLDTSGAATDPLAFWLLIITQVVLLLLFVIFGSLWIFKRVQPNVKTGLQLGLVAWVTFYVLRQIIFFVWIVPKSGFHPIYLYQLIPPPVPTLLIVLLPPIVGAVLEKNCVKME